MPDEVARAMRADLAARADEVFVWPENWPAVELFCAVATQWRASFGGLLGLDYAAVEATMRLQRIRPADRADLFGRLQVMERSALEHWRSARR